MNGNADFATNPAGIADTYQCPARFQSSDDRLGWLKQAVTESEAFLASQSAAQDFAKGRAVIAGMDTPARSKSLSDINANMTKRIVRDVAATLSNIRPLWGYSTDNRELQTIASLLNKLLMSWYLTTFADRKIKEALQYALVMGAGYVSPTWESKFWSRGRGEIILKTYGPEDVLPTQLPADRNLQRAYAVTLREEVPINLARAMFPTMAQQIVPDRTSPKGFGRFTGKVMSFLSPVLNRFGSGGRTKRPISAFPTVDIYQTYIMDLSVNEGPDPVVMGEPGTSWCYTVPVLGSKIPNGVNSLGEATFRMASVEDSMLYPFRRLVTWCSSCVLRDGPSPWWHGLVPAVQFSTDKWPWEFLGLTTVKDIASIGAASNGLRRAMNDSANARLRPTLMFDNKSMANAELEALDTRIPGQAIGVDLSLNERPVRPLLEAGYYDAPQWIPEMIASNDEMMKYLSGVQDVTAIAKARQIPSSDSIDKIMQMAGPMVEDMSRDMEASVGLLAVMMKGMFFQWYNSTRRLQMLGSDGIALEDGELYEAGSLTPSHMPGEATNHPSSFTTVERARKYMESFYFKITPGSLHQITQLSRKLLLIQLQKSGFPIDPWTLAEAFDIPNFGPPPKGTITVYDKWVASEKMKGELMAQIQAKTQEILQAAMLKMQLMMGGIMGAAGGPPGGGEPSGGGGTPPPGGQDGGNLPQASHSPALGDNPPGRPAEIKGNPQIQNKDGGTRSTIAG